MAGQNEENPGWGENLGFFWEGRGFNKEFLMRSLESAGKRDFASQAAFPKGSEEPAPDLFLGRKKNLKKIREAALLP